VPALSSLREVSRVDGRDCFELALEPRRCVPGRVGLVYEEQSEARRDAELDDIELRVLGGPCDDSTVESPG
jgi:hypothetical protein